MTIDELVAIVGAKYVGICNAKSPKTAGSTKVQKFQWDKADNALYIWI